MAWSEFYIDSGGANTNAGSVINAAASVTSTNGNWSTATNAFIATGGTPFSAVTVGEWVSIYNDGATTTPFIAQVVSIDTGGLGVTVSATVRLGTAPTTNATARSCKVGGSWVSFAICTSGPLSAGTAAVPTRINVQAATYANTTTSRTVAAAGTAQCPIWWRGYNTTPGDIDTNNALAKPEVTWTTGRFIVSGAQQVVSNLNITCTGAVTNPAVTMTGTGSVMDRCRIDNQHANAASSALNLTTNPQAIFRCYLKATTTATRVVSVTGALVGCYVTGGISGIDLATGVGTVSDCLVTGATTNGIVISSTSVAGMQQILRCSVYGMTNAVNVTSLTISNSTVSDCVFSTCTNGINNSSGVTSLRVSSVSNSYYSVTNPTVNLFEGPEWNALTESSDPFTNAAGGDFTLVPTALSRASGLPGPFGFENTSDVSSLDRGAVQSAASAASLIFIPVE